MGAILSAIIWFALGGLCTIVGFLKWTVWMLHKDSKNRETFCSPENRYETADWIESLFYDKKN